MLHLLQKNISMVKFKCTLWTPLFAVFPIKTVHFFLAEKWIFFFFSKTLTVHIYFIFWWFLFFFLQKHLERYLMFKENRAADQNWKWKTEKQNAPSLKTFGIKQLENQDYISQYMRTRNPPDVWQWLSTKENGKHHGRCLPAKKSAIPVTHSVSKRKHLVPFPARNWQLFQAKITSFLPGCTVEYGSHF